MSFRGVPLTTLGVLLLVAGTAVVLLYTVRWWLPRRVVSSTMLWMGAASRQRSGLLGRLDRVGSMLVQLCILLLILVAIGEPRWSCQSRGGRAAVLVLDVSSSMNAAERVEPRIDTARRRAASRLFRGAADDTFGLVLAGPAPEIAMPLTTDRALVRGAVERAVVRAGGGRLADAVSVACRLLAGRSQDSSIVVITDGSEPIGACPDSQMEAIFVGSARPNVGITAFAAAPVPADERRAEAYVEVSNASTFPARCELRLDLDGGLVRVATLDLAAGERQHRVFDGLPMSATGVLEARLARIELVGAGVEDALADDDHAYFILGARRTLAVNLVGQSKPVELALRSNPRLSVTRKPVAEAVDAVNVIIGPLPGALAGGRYLFVNPSGEGSPMSFGAPLDSPHITRWSDDHPVLRRVVLSDVVVEAATTTTLPPGAVTLASSNGSPLMYAFSDETRRIVGIAFDVERSNLPLRVGFPVLLYNAVSWLAESDETGVALDEDWTLPSREPLWLTPPNAKRVLLQPEGERVRVSPRAPGLYRLASAEGVAVAVLARSVADRGETALSPTQTLPAAPPAGRQRDRDTSSILILLAMALLIVEWTTYHRRITL